MRVAIIGAGVAGLATAKVLKQAGHEVVALDRSPDVGGVWSRTRRYPGLTTQSPKAQYSLSDFPMPRDFPEWPTGAQVQEYLAAYAAEFDLPLRLGTEVVAARPDGAGRWTVETAGGAEGFDRLVADELLRLGVVTTGIRFHIKGKHVDGLDFDRSRAATTAYQFILMAPQSEVEGLLLRDLASHGLTVERGNSVMSLSQNDTMVTARLVRDGAEHVLTCRYLVGADGAHSTVRQQLGVSFEGDQYTQRYLLADCRVEWPLDHSHFRVFMNGTRIGLFLPLRGSAVSRVMVTDPATTDRAPFALDELQEELRKAVCVPVTLHDPVWTSRYQVHLRQAGQYRAGRGFLVGDAAHIHSPAGGQGMNTGLQDAANLAWKLAAVLRTGAGEELLDSYADERHPVGVALLRFTDRLYRVAAGLRGWRAWLRDTVGPFLIARMSAAPIPHRKAFRRLSQIGVAYRPSEYNVNELLYSLRGPLAGQRAPGL